MARDIRERQVQDGGVQHRQRNAQEDGGHCPVPLRHGQAVARPRLLPLASIVLGTGGSLTAH